MGAPVYRTRGDIKSRVLARLGFGGLGAAAGPFLPYLDDILDEAQEVIFRLLPDEKKFREWTFTTGANQRWYDIPADCDIDRIRKVSAYYNQSWIEMARGIEIEHDAWRDQINYFPTRYDIRYNPDTGRTQIEIWPVPQSGTSYTFKIEGHMQLAPFVKDEDRASIDDRLIIQYAVAYGKAHLGRPDAEDAMAALNARLGQLKAEQHGERVYLRENPGRVRRAAREVQPFPKVVE